MQARKKRSPQVLLGGAKPISIDDESAVRAANYGLDELDKASNSYVKTCLHRIVSATTQVYPPLRNPNLWCNF